MALPLTPSDSKEYQAKNPIKPEDEFIVMFSGGRDPDSESLTEVFNRHGRGRIVSALTNTYWVKDMTWDLVNELRSRDDVSACGPVSKGPVTF